MVEILNSNAMMYCSKCRAPHEDGASFCPNCGTPLKYDNVQQQTNNNDRWLISLLLCAFGGVLGLHRFYTNNIATGVIMLLTGGGCGIWWIVDLIMIAANTYRDGNGNLLK